MMAVYYEATTVPGGDNQASAWPQEARQSAERGVPREVFLAGHDHVGSLEKS